MRFGYALLPDYPLRDSLASIELADELGFYACYAADETWHKDMWLLFAAAAGRTRTIRLGPSVSPVTLREPTLIAQALARFAFLCPALLDHPEVTTWALRRAFDDLGAVGVSVKANYNGVYLGDPSYDRFLAELDERSGVLFTHPLDLPGRPPGVPTVAGIPNFMCDFALDTTRAAVNLIRTRTLDRYPRLSVVLPHAGGFLPHIATRIGAFGDFCTPPIDAARVRDYLHRFYYDTAGPLSPACTLVATAGADRILYGTDWPAASADIITGFTGPAVEADHAFTDHQRRGIYRDNALRLVPALKRACGTT